MSLWAIIPIKPLQVGKSRLVGALSDTQRLALNQRMLTHTLDILKSVNEIEHVLVVSRDPAALALARDHGAHTVQEDGAPQLNLALSRATAVAKNSRASGVLILPADLPLINAQDVLAMLARALEPPVVAIAPDRHRQGTNALLVSPPGLIKYDFGPGSFVRHCTLALRAGASLEICLLPSLALDVDLPEDLEIIGKEQEIHHG